MSKIALKSLKNKLDEIYNNKFAVEIGIYDDCNNLSDEKLIPLGKYIYDPLPSNSEQEITENLCSRILK